ncbi:MAG: carbohydrate ABC transporter permease, partial [Candidatus Bipolaricaulia bacterium]
MKNYLPSMKVAAFIGPAILLIAIFYFLPAIGTIVLSFTNLGLDLQGSFVGLSNYFYTFSDPLIGKVLLNTIVYVFFTLLFFNVGMALILAILTSYTTRKWSILFRLIWLLPRMSPPLVYITIWRFLTDPSKYGALNVIRMDLFGAKSAMSVAAQHPWMLIIIVNGFIGASMGMLVFASSIESIPKDYLRAARVDGASEWKIVKKIILPLIRWPIMFITIYQTLALLTSFKYILAL